MLKNMLNKIFTNTKFISIIFAILTFSGLALLWVIPRFDTVSWIILIVLILFFQKMKLYDKEYFKISLILAIIFSFLTVFGKITYENIDVQDVLIWKELIKVTYLLSFVCLIPLYYVLLIKILPFLKNIKLHEEKTNSRKVFLISFIIIFLCWIPYFLAMYPGLLSPDSIVEMDAVLRDLANVSNHHPVTHQLLIWIFYKIGMFFTNDINTAVAFYAIGQMLIMDYIFSSFASFLSKKKVNKIILGIVILSFALLPNHAYYSITMWKDIIFSGLVLLLTMRIIDLCDNDFQKKDLIIFVIISLLTLLFRNNAIYAYFIFIIGMLLIFKKHLKKLLTCFGIVVISYYVITIPVFKALNVTKSSSAEYLAIPIQQIARMAYKDVEFTDEETELLEKLIGVENLKILYNPASVDRVKFNQNFHIEVFDENKAEFFKIWLNLVIKHFDIATESYAVSTLGYWYPGVNYWPVIKEITPNDFGIEMTPKGLPIVNKVISRIESRYIPLLNIIWSTSIVMWLIVIFAYITIKKKGLKYLSIYIFPIGLWFTLMLATPIYAEYRYIYYLYTTLPLFLLIPYLNAKKDGSSN